MNYEKVAHSSDEPAWHAGRMTGATATDASRLANGGASSWAAVRAEKAGAVGFQGNRFTNWGHEREPVIAQWVQATFGLEPSGWLLRSKENPLWLATPDCLGETALAEIKTTVKAWASLAEIPKRYIDQIQWQLLVTGLPEAILAFEVHENFRPVEMEPRFFIVPRDEARIAELISIVDEFWETDPETSEFDDLLAEYAVAQEAVEQAQAVVADIKARVKERIGDRPEVRASSALGSVTYSQVKPRETFDSKRFAEVHPDLHPLFMKKGESTTRLSITPKGRK